MIKWLWRVIWGGPPKPQCMHTWEIYHTMNLYENGKTNSSLPVATVYILKCAHCGDMTKRRMDENC